MAVKTERDLPPNARNLWLKALSAFETRNYGYALALLQGVLKDHAAFLAGRQLLRRAALMQQGKGSTRGGLLGRLSAAAPNVSIMKAQQTLKKDPLAALVAVEEVLEKDPAGIPANLLLRDAALAAGLPETAAFALETLRDAHPKDAKVLHELARHYAAHSQPDRAAETYSAILELNPADLDAVKGAKDASARDSMRQGGWEEAKDYRDVLRNKEEAVSLEQQSRFTRSDEMFDRQLAELSALYEAEPENVDVARRIAALYEEREDWANAVTWHEYAWSLTHQADEGIGRRLSAARLRLLERQIADDESLPGGDTVVAERVAGRRAERAELLVAAARDRVDRNPTDLQFRFDLGEQLVLAGRHAEAIQELQKARASASLGVRAGALLAQCYETRGLLDLARKQYAEAAAKLPQLDATKKAVLYALAMVNARMGDRPAYLEALKQIYEEDYTYRDVAALVETEYQAGEAQPESGR